MAAGKRAPQGDAGAASDSESAGRSGSGPRAARGAARTWPRAGTSGSAALLLPAGHGAPQPSEWPGGQVCHRPPWDCTAVTPGFWKQMAQARLSKGWVLPLRVGGCPRDASERPTARIPKTARV